MKGLKYIRKKAGLTQMDLAAKLGVTQSLVAMWERGATLPNAAKLPELADVLHCTIDALYGREPFRAEDKDTRE
ncbi:helix-turn-helix domain-containing protein [Intestinimonas butyriciproducens]|uniref:helix-turn-helix domain-containing protein n=1 Tax=Intestinimonas butyriciproducens TaxID=1297617 RepID=UPI00195B6B2A|nr:helix-turn-helix transcriptional regulator [Intestinimonas butyriciproducens]MBM6976972.1 helix-turn-helix transcriptional regulator [Intestinimonas butyriciproducens]